MAQQSKFLPFMNGKYEVAPGLRMLQPGLDHPAFDVDANFERYRLAKLNAVQQKPSSSYEPQDSNLRSAEKFAVCEYIMGRISSDWPEHFVWDKSKQKISSNLTKESMAYPEGGDLFGFLAMQLQEDLAIWKLDPDDKKEWLASMHVMFPGGWAPEDKIGKSFATVHQPVPGFEQMAEKSWQFATSMVKRGPFERFVWGLYFDDELDHHPKYKPRAPYNSLNPKLFVRVERQTLHPFSALNLALFTIRLYLYDVATLSSDERTQLRKALESMDEDELRYKGLDGVNLNALAL